MAWVTKKIYNFLSDLFEGLIETFGSLIINLFTSETNSIISSSQVLGAVMVTTGVATAMISVLTMKQLFCTHILETDGDPDSDPLQQLVKASVAIALIQTNSTILNVLLRYAALFTTSILNGAGNTLEGLNSGAIVLNIASAGVSSIVAIIFGLIYAVGMVMLALKAGFRTVELAAMEILYPIFCLDILTVQQERWKTFFASYLVTIFGYAIQILCFVLSIAFAFSGLGGFFVALAFLFFAVKAPNWLEKYAYSSGAGRSAAGAARSVQQFMMMRRMYRR